MRKVSGRGAGTKHAAALKVSSATKMAGARRKGAKPVARTMPDAGRKVSMVKALGKGKMGARETMRTVKRAVRRHAGMEPAETKKMAEYGLSAMEFGVEEWGRIMGMPAACFQASSRMAGDVYTLTRTGMRLGRDMMQMQRAYLNMAQDASANMRRMVDGLMRSRTMMDVAAVQQRGAMDGAKFMLDSAASMMRVATNILQR